MATGKRIEELLGFVEGHHRRGRLPGGQLCLSVGGEELVSHAFGVARGFRPSEEVAPELVTADTPFLVFSAGKPVMGIAMAMLESRGLLDPAAPVATYWPEFAAHGKEAITVLDVLTHRAGVFRSDLVTTPSTWVDPDRLADELAATTPRYARGTFAYMPYEFGWILGEVLRRITGRTPREFVAEEIAGPLGLEPFSLGVSEADCPRVALSYWVGSKRTRVAGVRLADTWETANNSREALTSIVPGAGLITTARQLTRFYAWILGGCRLPDGSAAVDERVLRATTGRNVFGFDRSNRVPLAVGRGFVVGTPWPSAYGLWGTSSCFGHQGAFCTVGMADEETGLAFSLVTNGNLGTLGAAPVLGGAVQRARAVASGLRC